MATWVLRKLFNIRVGEGRRTALLYLLFFLLILGSVWGETTAEGLFLAHVGTDNYSFRFITEAVVTLVFTLIYTAFVDRVNNRLLLAVICGLTVVALLASGLWLPTQQFAAFYFFYLIGRVSRVIFAVHTWTYASEFFDTRTARRLFPLIGSSGRVAGILGGLALRFLVIPLVHAEAVPYIWAGLLAVSAWLALSIPRWTRGEAALPESRGPRGGVLENLREGWRAVRGLDLLRLLAVSTTVMTILLALVNFQTDYIFSTIYKGADSLAGVFGLLKSLANLIALPLQLFLLTRIVNRIGVGWANLIYPLIAVSTYGLLGLTSFDIAFTWLPLALAVLGLFVLQGFLSGLRNPLDNMLYNAVPQIVKGRARAFVNGMLVPLATLIAGLSLLLVPRGSTLPWHFLIPGGIVGLVYLFTSWQIRRAYSKTLVTTLATEDTALSQLVGVRWDTADRAALDLVLQRLRESSDEGTSIFLAQLAYEVGDRDALPALSEIAAQRGPTVRAAILEIVGGAGLADARVRQLCVAGLADADPIVRRAALNLLAEQSSPEDTALVELAVEHLRDPDPEARATAISLLLRSGEFYYLTTAASALNEMLTAADPALRALALAVFGELGDPRFTRTVLPHLRDPHESVRRAAAQALVSMASAAVPPWVQLLLAEAAQQALSDHAEAIRLAAVAIIAKLNLPTLRPALLQALGDDSIRVREAARQVLESMGTAAVDDLEALAAAAGEGAREAAILALLHLSTEQYRARAHAEIDKAQRQLYEHIVLIDALMKLKFPGAVLAADTLSDRSASLLAHIFHVLVALHGEKTVHVIQHNLQALDVHARANAIEALEAISSPQTARLIAPPARGPQALLDEEARAEMMTLAQEELHLQPIEPAAALETLLTGQDPWLKAVGLYLVGEVGQPGLALFDAPRLISRARSQEVIQQALDSPDRLVAETAQYVAYKFRFLSPSQEGPMLSTIEKVIFLKEIPFFQEMTVAQLRTLAGIAEERSFKEDEIICHEDDPGDTLYVVVSGRVGIEHAAETGTGSVARLATLESRQYFGEMSIFDRAPYPATAIAIGRTLLLCIRREPLIALVEENPSLALELIRILSRQLREASDQIASRTRVRPRQLHKLYDSLI